MVSASFISTLRGQSSMVTAECRGQCGVLTRYHSPGDLPATWRHSDHIGPLPSGNRVALCSPGIGICYGFEFAFPVLNASA